MLARVIAAGAVGAIDPATLPPRLQDFYNASGKPVTYAELPLVDGTAEIERIGALVGREGLRRAVAGNTSEKAGGADDSGDGDGAATPTSVAGPGAGPGVTVADSVPFEGALVGSRPFIFPLPVALFFGKLFAIATSSRVGESI